MPTIIELQLSPDDYVLEFVNDDGVHECMLGIAADDSEAEDVGFRFVTIFCRLVNAHCSFCFQGLKGWTFGQVRETEAIRTFVHNYDVRTAGSVTGVLHSLRQGSPGRRVCSC